MSEHGAHWSLALRARQWYVDASEDDVADEQALFYVATMRDG